MTSLFHLIKVHMSILNKRFGSAGMRDALVQSSIAAEGSVDSASREKSYDHGIRHYKIFYGAVTGLIIVELDPGTNLHEDFDAAAKLLLCRERSPQFEDGDEFRKLLDMYINLEWSNFG